MTLLSQIARYRGLQQDRDAGVSMSLHELLELEALGQSLRDRAQESAEHEMPAVLSTNTIEHVLRIKRVGPDSIVCTRVPGVLPSTSFGLRLDDAIKKQSYLYRVTVAQITYVSSDSDCEVELSFIGRPVMLSWGRGRSNSPEAVIELEAKLCA